MPEGDDDKKAKGVDISKIVIARDRHLRAARFITTYMENLNPKGSKLRNGGVLPPESEQTATV